MDHSVHLADPAVPVVSAAAHILPVHSDNCLVKSDCNPYSGSAAVQAAVAAGRSLAVSLSAVRHSTAAVDVAGVADPTADVAVVAAVEAEGRKIVGEQEAKPGCIASVVLGCTMKSVRVEIAAVHRKIDMIRGAVVEAVDTRYSIELRRTTVAVTYTVVGQGLSSLGSGA